MTKQNKTFLDLYNKWKNLVKDSKDPVARYNAWRELMKELQDVSKKLQNS